MSIVLIENTLRGALTGTIVGGWPIRWPNEPWPPGIETSDGNLPINPDGTPQPCVITQFVTGADTAAIGGAGQRVATRLGLFRIFLLVGQNTGAGAMQAQIDAIWPAFKRQTLYADPPTWARLTTMDPRIDDDVAMVETGDRYTRMITVPWIFEYRN